MPPKDHRKRIVYLQYTNPGAYPPLQHSADLLAGVGWEILFAGTGALGADALRLTQNPAVTVRQLPFCPGGIVQKLHFVWFCLWACWHAVRFRAAWVYASDPMACPAALLIHHLFRLPIIYHEHDAPPPEATLPLVLKARQACARSAVLCVIPNAARAAAFAAEQGVDRLAVVWNCPILSEAAEPKRRQGAEIRVLYHGSIVPERVPLQAIDALAALPAPVSLVLVGYETVGSSGYVDRLRSRARELGIEARLEYRGQVPHRSDLMAIARSCDIGLSLLPGVQSDWNLKTLVGASNKVFDYLACGLPVVVSAIPEWEELVTANGYGVSCDPACPDDIARALLSLASDGAARLAMGEAGRHRILSEWNYEMQFRPVWKVLHGEVAAAGHHGSAPAALEPTLRRQQPTLKH